MKKVETKVLGGVIGGSTSLVVANFLLWVLSTYVSVSAAAAPQVVAFVTTVVGGVGYFVGGYFSRHTHKSQL